MERLDNRMLTVRKAAPVSKIDSQCKQQIAHQAGQLFRLVRHDERVIEAEYWSIAGTVALTDQHHIPDFHPCMIAIFIAQIA